MAVKDEELHQLLKIFEKMRKTSEMKAFLLDLLSASEIDEIARRWKAARMLADGARYVEICKATGLSSTTVARVSRCVRQGSGGYQLALQRRPKTTKKF